MSNTDRNSNGRFGHGNKAATVRKAKQAAGSTGVVATGGYVWTGETSAGLIGINKWTTYANAFTRPPVAISMLLRSTLLSGVKWSLGQNEAGGKDAERGLEIVQQGLLGARLPTPWNLAFAKAANGSFFNGFSLHAFAMGRRKDGMVVFTDIAHRPQHTILKWLRPNDQAPFDAVEQLTRDGKSYSIPLSECLYLVNHQLMGDSPDGVGILRLLVERIRRVGNYEVLEGAEMFSSMAGTPILRAPLEDIAAGAPKDPALRAAYIAAATTDAESLVQNRIKTPERQQWMKFDSAVFSGADPNVFSTTQKWGIEILKGDLQGLPEIRKTITDEDLNLARMLGVEFVFVGGGDSTGTYGMHESKVDLFAAALQADCTTGAIAVADQLARRLIAANGLDPDTATPTLIPEKITLGSVLETAQALALIGGLHKKDPARAILRERLEVPPEPEELLQEDLMAPRFAADPNIPPAPPDPKQLDPGKAEPVPGEPTQKRAPLYAKGDRVVSLVDHMDGMKGMAGKVAIARAGTPPYYGVRFDDQKMFAGTHKWLAEDEIKPETKEAM